MDNKLVAQVVITKKYTVSFNCVGGSRASKRVKKPLQSGDTSSVGRGGGTQC